MIVVVVVVVVCVLWRCVFFLLCGRACAQRPRAAEWGAQAHWGTKKQAQVCREQEQSVRLFLVVHIWRLFLHFDCFSFCTARAHSLEASICALCVHCIWIANALCSQCSSVSARSRACVRASAHAASAGVCVRARDCVCAGRLSHNANGMEMKPPQTVCGSSPSSCSTFSSSSSSSSRPHLPFEGPSRAAASALQGPLLEPSRTIEQSATGELSGRDSCSCSWRDSCS